MQPPTHNIVSSDSELLILVDEDDKEVGSLSKSRCHDGNGILHRAFSVFLFNAQGELLLQQRSKGKRLWPEYWTNTCCSHPRQGESLELATERRLQQELGTTASLEFIYKFSYQAQFGELGAEHELCSVFLGQVERTPAPNETEIAELRYVAPASLDREIAAAPERFTPWFKMEWERLNRDFPEQLAAYIGGS
jgi:isopentenyl-diphosphate delta-isomerase